MHKIFTAIPENCNNKIPVLLFSPKIPSDFSAILLEELVQLT